MMPPLTFQSVLVWIITNRWNYTLPIDEITGLYIAKLESCPSPVWLPWVFLFSLLEARRLVHFLIFQAGTTQFTSFDASFPHPFFPAPQGKCSDPYHISVLLFITNETREKKYYMWRTCKDYRNVVNPYKILLKSYHFSTIPWGMISENLFESLP